MSLSKFTVESEWSKSKLLRWLPVPILILAFSNFGVLVGQYSGFVERAPLDLPPGSYDVKDLGKGWHTFRLDIAGKKRIFLQRLSLNYSNTESLSELIEPQ